MKLPRILHGFIFMDRRKTNFEEKNFYGFAKKLRDLRKLFSRKLISANITLLKVFFYWKLKKVMQ